MDAASEQGGNLDFKATLMAVSCANGRAVGATARRETVKPRRRRRTSWGKNVAPVALVGLFGVQNFGCKVEAPLPPCDDAVVITFPALDLTTKPSASVWVDGFRYCKNAVLLDESEYRTQFSPGGFCGLRRSGELFVLLFGDEPRSITVRLNYDQTPGPTRTFEVDFDDVDRDAEGCRRLERSF